MINESEPNDSKTNPRYPLLAEFLVVAAILCVFLAIGFIQASKLPVFLDTWWDEILFVDPAANLHSGQGFTSSAWFAQSKEKFWAGYPPLYTWLLYLWIKLFSFSLSAARSLNYLLAALSALTLWMAVIRLNLVTSAVWRAFLLVLLLVSVGYGFEFRTGRPDILMVTLVIVTFLAYSIQIKYLRYLSLTCLCAIFPFVGIGLIAYTIIFSSFIFIFLKQSFIKELIAIYAGLAIGSFGLFSFYTMHGVWHDFIVSTLTNPSLSLPNSQITFLNKLILNFSLGFTSGYRGRLLLIFILAVIIYKILTKKFKFYSLDFFGLVVGLGIPLGMRTVGSYPFYYDWMTCLPMAVCLCTEIPKLLRSDIQLWLRPAVLGLTITLILFAPPLRLLVFVTHLRSLDYAVIENFVDENIHKSDWVMADPLAYYALRHKAETVFHPFYIQVISEEEKEKISVIITKPSLVPSPKFVGDFKNITDKLGGSWSDTGQKLTLHGAKSLVSAEQIELKVYRRRK